MAATDAGKQFGNKYLATVHRGAISIAFTSGSLALVAMLVGTPLQIGSALAVCATAWIVAHIAEQFVEQERVFRNRARRRRALTTHDCVRLGPSPQRLDGPVYFAAHRRPMSTV
jgi:hypothetical protein